MQTCGIENEEIYYVVEEYQIIKKEVLDIVSCLIVSGEVMGLYQNDELESLCAPLKDQMSQQNFDGTPTQFFTQSKSLMTMYFNMKSVIDLEGHLKTEYFYIFV